MKVFRFRAIVSLDPPEPGKEARQYPPGCRGLMLRCGPHQGQNLPAAIYRADELPLAQGDRSVVVTMEVADDSACAVLDAGERFAIWNGTDIGHGIISRRVFFTWAA